MYYSLFLALLLILNLACFLRIENMEADKIDKLDKVDVLDKLNKLERLRLRHNEANKRYRAAHRDAIRAHSRQAYHNNRDAVLARVKAYYQQHRSEILAQRKQAYMNKKNNTNSDDTDNSTN